MMKRAIALILCLVMCLSTLALVACSKKDEEYKGEYMIMYLTENMYDLDPANAYYNESTRQVVSMLFETLFTLNDKGKVKKALADDYKIIEDKKSGEYKMEITIGESFWSDNTPITANDVVFAWKRILDVEASYEAAALLYDIKNARAVKEGEVSIDDLGLYADNKIVTIEFEGPIDYDQFLVNLTSVALAPLNETAVKTEDWAKKPATMVCSGAFKLSRINFIEDSSVKFLDNNYAEKKPVEINGEKTSAYVTNPNYKKFSSQVISSFIIERNPYYFRNTEDEKAIDSSVTPYRILVDCSLSDEQLKDAYESGYILYMGDIPLSLREDYKDSKQLTVEDSLSTHTYYLNHNALVKKSGSTTGEAIFAIKEVRQALSMAIDREAIANMVVFAEAATGIVPTGVFASGTVKDTFREVCNNNYSALTKNMDEAERLLDEAGINPSKYSFSVTVAAYDEVHVAIAEQVVKAWNDLGFNVEIKLRGTIANNDYFKDTDSIPNDICDDLYMKDLKAGDFEVIALDAVATAATPYAVLAPFAKAFSGQGMIMPSFTGNESGEDAEYVLTPHISGYDSKEYNALMETIFEEKNIENRNDNLIKAEKMLMDDMAVIPVIFNKYATLKSDELKLNNKTLWWEKNSNYYSTTNFRKMTVKNYDEYLTLCADYLADNYDDYVFNSFSYFYSFREFDFEEFKKEGSNYSFLFPEVED